jgi:hypothetical protein
MLKNLFFVFLNGCLLFNLQAQNIKNNPKSNHGNKFEQLGSIIPDANNFRTASGAPGHEYWQQKADYKIEARLDENSQTLYGKEWITYHNLSPDPLNYLWLQLDENQHHPDAESNSFDQESLPTKYSSSQGLLDYDYKKILDGFGVNIVKVKDANGKDIPFTINYTMMRIDIPSTLKPGKKIKFFIEWNYKIPNRMKQGGRGGFEFFDDDGQCLYTISQWFPRMCVYGDNIGWNNKQFTGRGEFALAFGDYDVKMDVPSDHIIASTGVLQNEKNVLNTKEISRWKLAQTSSVPVEIVTREEAINKEKNPEKNTRKIWHFKAENVRDFAWGSSRKFIWDAMAVNIEGKKIMAMSFYPDEAYSLYNKYSTKVVAHTIKTYSKFTCPYPYPVAISVEASNGMEYPMICFNFGRTDKDGSYTEGTKHGMIGVITHEVGHNFFPMIINSDERQWTWMDEGLNTFVQFLTEQEFDNNYPSRGGFPSNIVDYMKLPPENLEPIMTNSENIIQYGSNAYQKPATALNILRETILGRKLFDHAFKEYSMRWRFKHPSPSDFFRTMEDASGVDLDWFWRGWFYDIEPVDISLDTIIGRKLVRGEMVPVRMDTIDNKPFPRRKFKQLTQIKNKEEGIKFLVEQDKSLQDFYYTYKPEADKNEYLTPTNLNENLAAYSQDEWSKLENGFLYELRFTNKGGLVMPIILEWNYDDGTREIEKISAYVWRRNESKATKTFYKNKKVKSVRLDPYRETADIDTSNNGFPKEIEMSPLEIFKSKETRTKPKTSNPMQKGGL